MTEDEAKTKWCPFARERAAQGMPDGGGNRAPYGGGDHGPVEDDYTREAAMLFPCIGSACMAWRWVMVGADYKTGKVIRDMDLAVSRAQGRSFPNTSHLPMESFPTKYVASEHGYCGLVGKP